jgi:hypothetical protein
MSWDNLPRVMATERGPASALVLEPPHILAGRALIAIRALYRAHGQLTRREGDHLELLLRKRWYARFGFSSFRDFSRESLQLSPSTARRRIALSRVANERTEFAAALDSGRLSPCQILALSPMREAPSLSDWIEIAQDCTVRELEQIVADYLSGDESEKVSADETVPADEPGRRITFAAPASAAVAWAQAMDMAQRVLGWDAPHYRCIEAVLAETTDVLFEETAAAGSLSEGEIAPAKVVGHPSAGKSERSVDAKNAGANTASPFLKVRPEQLEALQRTIQLAEREMTTMAAMAVPCEDDPDRSIAILAELKRKDRSLRLLFAQLLREADAANVLAFLGYSSITDLLVSRLKISTRTAARFMSEAWTFEDSPELARAFASGRIGLGQAYLVDRVAARATQRAFILRAETVTHLQFEREIRFLERFADCLPSIAREFHGPFPHPQLSSVLIECLRKLGWSGPRIEECVGPSDDDGVDAEGDPAVNPSIMVRLEGLLDLVAVALEEHDAAVGALPTLDTQAADSPQTETNMPTLDTPSIPLPTLDTPQDGTLSAAFGGSAFLPTLATHGPALRTTISFWAPESLITQWNTALTRIQATNGPLPTWAAAVLLVRRAVEEWERVDPSRRPDNLKILERDEWRCQAPGCTSRSKLEAHHIIFRSQNGSDDPENLITLCHGHHRHGIHDGYLCVQGTAPDELRWRLGGGQLPGGVPRPTRAYHGSRQE